MATLNLKTYLGPYYLEKLLATGGMAEIYLARTKGIAGFEKQLVLKVIRPAKASNEEVVNALMDEAKLTVQLNHPNIVQTFDLGRINETTFLTMEYVDGLDFFQLLMRLSNMNEVIPIEAALYVVIQVLEGLRYAHNKCDEQGKPLNIIHRDVSPQNVLLSRNGEVKIVDFGIARAANISRRTKAGVIKGKLVYMSPEQARGNAIDNRTDLFSAGIVLYEALTMGSLYLEQNPSKLLQQVRKAAIDPPSHRRAEIPGELDALVMKALTPVPDDRYQTAQEFGQALTGYQRRLSPEYSEVQLSALVEAVLAGKKPQPQQRPKAARPRRNTMDRQDYGHKRHSIIFSDSDLMRSSSVSGVDASRVTAELIRLGDEDAKPCKVGESFIMGRAGDLELGDARVSRRHASINYKEGAYLLEDLGSSNGTYLNDTQITRPCPLSNGDIIRIGPFELRFVLCEKPAVVKPPVPENAEFSTLPSGQASATLSLGSETLTLPLGKSLPLDHRVGVGGAEILGCGATVIHRPDGYWLEPAPKRLSVFHNGKKLSGPVLLGNGDKVGVGPIEVSISIINPSGE